MTTSNLRVKLSPLDSRRHHEQKKNIKHRKGIDLQGGRGTPIYVGELEDVATDLRKMMEWECVGGRCVVCEREAWLDRWDLQRGRSSIILSQLAERLRCRGCGNKTGNRMILGRLPRD
ncbi:hypothetical protein ELI56_02365 [Rhizobium ruizarguesonis]|uniref:hypothetical protein n=1 Tax=Rhizobium ruizarguesonis TaxID=2081791 RepID=UPI001030A83D|nr:hypothetical protein [Rhizobium ruizarguesonis]TAT77140.1 hypothetical protein ELI56_02365 [Rhizobium ruizarguesonis]